MPVVGNGNDSSEGKSNMVNLIIAASEFRVKRSLSSLFHCGFVFAHCFDIVVPLLPNIVVKSLLQCDDGSQYGEQKLFDAAKTKILALIIVSNMIIYMIYKMFWSSNHHN